MMIFGIIIVVLAILFLLYLLSTTGRKGHPGFRTIEGWSYAHRGLHDDILPENSMAAFKAALENGYGIELDIHLLKDGNLAVIHDSRLKRTTGAEGEIEDLTTEQLTDYRLEETGETIPEFRQVLELFDGKAPMIIELKAAGGNHDRLCQAACAMLEGYEGPYCMESFDPRCVFWLKKNRPDIIRGQLTEDYFATGESRLNWLLKFALKHQMLNFLTRPDFVAYRFADRKTIGNTFARKFWGIRGVTWTLKNREDYDTAVSEGWLPIFEGFRP